MRILIVDESEKDRDNLKITLESLVSAQIVMAKNAKEAVSLAERGLYEIAYIRIQSENEGLVLARKLQEINPHINLIFVSDTAKYAGSTWQVYPSGYLLLPLEKGIVRENLSNLRYPVREVRFAAIP